MLMFELSLSRWLIVRSWKAFWRSGYVIPLDEIHVVERRRGNINSHFVFSAAPDASVFEQFDLGVLVFEVQDENRRILFPVNLLSSST